MTKPTKCVCTQRRQISLGIRPVRSESSLCIQWIDKDPTFLHADSEDSDQTWGMPRLPPSLIRVFAGRTLILLVLSCHGSNEPADVKRLLISDHIGKQWRLRRASAFTQSGQSPCCWLSQYRELEEASDKELYLWPFWVAAHVCLKDSKTHGTKIPFLMNWQIYNFPWRLDFLVVFLHIFSSSHWNPSWVKERKPATCK